MTAPVGGVALCWYRVVSQRGRQARRPHRQQVRPAREGSRDGACRSGSAIVKEEDTVEEGPDMEWFCRGSRGRD
jgi:hypothetical protein